MTDPYELYRTALNDPTLNGIGCILPEDIPRIKAALKSNCQAAYISEWDYRGNTIVHVHSKEFGEKLKRQFAAGPKPRHPDLVGVYEVSRLETTLRDSA